MSTIDPALMPATDLAHEIAARRISPVDAVESCLRRIDTLEPSLQAFTEVYAEDARLAAEGADKAIRSGHAVGPWHGVPVALKDLIELEGRVTMGGSAAHRGRRSAYTATVARKLIAQGMIIIGKTHTVEFAYGGWGTNQHLGTPRNPWDNETHRIPGGSSSGSAVSVAARMVPWAIGTDTGGSVRMPSSFCGLTGLKLTSGRASTYGIIPLSSSLDTPGPMARSVEDAAWLYTILSGPDGHDPLTRGIEAVDPMPTLRSGVRGLRLGRLPDADRDGVEADVLLAYDRSLDHLANLGAEIVQVTLPFRMADMTASSPIVSAEVFHFHREVAENEAALMGDVVRARIMAGASVSAHDYLAAKRAQRDLKARYAEATAGLDAFLTPTTVMTAVPLAEVDETIHPTRMTRFANLLELCGLALPNGFTPGGLPTSLQIVCRAYDEAMALRIGQAYQQATDWHLRVPS